MILQSTRPAVAWALHGAHTSQHATHSAVFGPSPANMAYIKCTTAKS